MKHCLIFIMAVSLGVSARAEDEGASPKSPSSPAEVKANAKPAADESAHDGVWKPIAAVLGGMRLPKAALNAITLKVNGKNYVVTAEGEDHADKGTFSLDTSAIPKRMTIKSTDGPNKGKTILAIYEMKDAVSMRVCYDLSGKEFPQEFKAKKGTQLYLVGYRRQKKKAIGK